MLNRYYSNKIDNLLKSGKVLVIYGPRRVGKTTLIIEFLKNYKGKLFSSTGKNSLVKEILESSDFSKILPFFSGFDLIFIDEAQKIEKIGQGLKIIVDQLPKIKIIATGSSSFELSNKVGEPLVGRQNIIKLYPLAVSELIDNHSRAYATQELEKLLIFGNYPEVVTSENNNDKIKYLTQIRDSYLYKDLLELEQLKNAKKILDLLRLIAFQIGQEVSLQELGQQLEMGRNTVERYLDLLEKAFVIINIRGYSRNLRKEITKTSRYYFYDNGVRNAVIGNFNFLNSRNDIGQLWENFLVLERLKKQEYRSIFSNNYFWRTWDQQEIDWVEERDGKLFAYEFKWGRQKIKSPKDFFKAYPNSQYQVITKDNYLDFIA